MKSQPEPIPANYPAVGSKRYDYSHQTFVERVPSKRGGLWSVLRCGHPKPFAHCYACQNHGRTLDSTEVDIRPEPQCGVEAGTAADLWDCSCPECITLQREAN